jgi:hypothetical protein
MSNKAARERRQRAHLTRVKSAAVAERRKNRITNIAAILGFLVIVGGVLAYAATKGHGTGTVSTSAAVAPAPPAPPAGTVPTQIAANIAQENRVIETPIKAKLAALHGVPVVVNQWAAWCPKLQGGVPILPAGVPAV